jgi:ABC-type transporter Mla maintaining outer membrane lipid asymmetry ATPase subunit MlaF
VSGPLLAIAELVKDYRGLRPLRVRDLVVGTGDHLAILGFDRPAAEVLVNLITGASLPDAGDVVAFGRSTAAIQDSTEWLEVLDRFGIVSDRAVLLDSLTVVQNLAMPFTLEIEPPADEVSAQARALAQEVGLPAALVERPIAALSGADRTRVRAGRALAFAPRLLLLEHPTATVEPADVSALARDLRAAAGNRGIATLTLTADRDFAEAIASRVLMVDPASGRLADGRSRSWFRRRSG